MLLLCLRRPYSLAFLLNSNPSPLHPAPCTSISQSVSLPATEPHPPPENYPVYRRPQLPWAQSNTLFRALSSTGLRVFHRHTNLDSASGVGVGHHKYCPFVHCFLYQNQGHQQTTAQRAARGPGFLSYGTCLRDYLLAIVIGQGCGGKDIHLYIQQQAELVTNGTNVKEGH